MKSVLLSLLFLSGVYQAQASSIESFGSLLAQFADEGCPGEGGGCPTEPCCCETGNCPSENCGCEAGGCPSECCSCEAGCPSEGGGCGETGGCPSEGGGCPSANCPSYFQGHGKWKTKTGETGNYQVVVEVTKSECEVQVTERYSFPHGHKVNEFTIKKGSHGFFGVWKGLVQVGKGYCWEAAGVNHGGTVCHMEGGGHERTLHFAGTIGRMGSFDSVAWTDMLEASTPEFWENSEAWLSTPALGH